MAPSLRRRLKIEAARCRREMYSTSASAFRVKGLGCACTPGGTSHLERSTKERGRRWLEWTSERPTASVEQVWRLSAPMPPRFRALVIFAAFTGLRWGELVALRGRDVDLDAGLVHVVRKFAELQNGERLPGRP